MKQFTFGNFPLGRIVATPGALETFEHDFLIHCLARHAAGDWGELDTHDIKENELSLREGYRLLSAYSKDDEKLWIITEADRSVTTFLLPSEY